MPYGRLAVSAPAATTNTVVYTVPSNCLYAEITVNILNTNATTCSCNLAVSTSGTSTPAANEYIEKEAILPASGGVLERTDLVVSPGEKIIIYTALANTVVRVSGKVVASL